ncbi:MAG: hemerythrin domain-containing protein [Sporichthyaceae bacterium]|nr:hemerythrin domain-containing protein [Sporichthyaceae bacterium]
MNGGSSLTAVVHDDHQRLRGMLRAAMAATSDPADPRRPQALCDTFLATLSRHLAAVEDVLYPALHAVQPHGRAAAISQVHAAREMERQMRQLEGSFYGDHFAVSTPHAQLWAETAAMFESHVRDEERLTTRLDSELPEPQRRALVDAFLSQFDAAPTRPHPYSPHSRRAGRLSHKLWSWADRAMDVMDNRRIPHKPPVPHPSRNSRWTQYVLGRARFEPSAEPGAGRNGQREPQRRFP